MASQQLSASRPAGLPPPPPPLNRVRRARAAIVEVVRARELTMSLVRRDLKVRHRGTFLGMLWSLTTPLLLVALYYLVFKYVLGAQPATDATRPDNRVVPFAIYFFAALTVWNLFSSSVSMSTGSIVGSGYLLRKVYFPRAILPLSAVLSSIITFGFEFAVLVVATLLVVGLPSAQLLWVPVIVLVVAVMAYGIALFVSAVTVFLRDVEHFIGIFMQLWFWGTPIIYSLKYVQDRQGAGVVRLLEANPMTGVAVSFRNVTVLNRPPDLKLLAYDLACGVVFLVVGAFVFRRWQRLFSEIV
ncbi:MAG: ABC transporter permease [Actinomycetota bacterium]|nr:ABC transporter permease [Actinomycetota bacterium]